MPIKEFFTLPDSDLSQESSVDPMGLQVIWTTYGQAIFNEKLTTIANDLRIFTFNLFHNYFINNLYKYHIEELQVAKGRYKGWQSDADVKAGLLMFLEDLVTWVFFLHKEESGTDTDRLGILGMLKARSAYYSKDQNDIYLTANKRAGLLKNQLNLGMSGRYKGPMMNMEFFDRSYSYLEKAWEPVYEFMNKWEDAKDLAQALIALISDVLTGSKKIDYPQVSLEELKSRQKLWKQVGNGYLKCFGKGKLPKNVRIYWQDKLGLKSGASGAIYNQISLLNSDDQIDHRAILSRAKQDDLEPGEKEKLKSILTIEPLLSHSEYLLRYISQQSVKNLKDVKDDLALLRVEIKKVGNFSIPDSHPRLLKLQSTMSTDGTMDNWLNGVLAYHNDIMDQRGGNVWVELDDKGSFKHYFCTSLVDHMSTVPGYLQSNVWLHTYYLETLRSIHAGLN